jgi:hypothetical protein
MVPVRKRKDTANKIRVSLTNVLKALVTDSTKQIFVIKIVSLSRLLKPSSKRERIHTLKCIHVNILILCRTSGNLCLTFSTIGCNDASSNPPIVAPQLITFPKRKHHGQNHLAVILGTVGGSTLAIFLICLSVFIYNAKRRYQASHRTSMYSLTSCLYSYHFFHVLR